MGKIGEFGAAALLNPYLFLLSLFADDQTDEITS